jgi:alpha 1,2-mannosyltransferase
VPAQRWGDAPVHSIAAALFLPRSALHFFDRIGYTHLPFSRCPRSAAHRAAAACDCVAKDSMDTEPFSCTKRWWEVNAPAGVPASAVGEVVWDEI